MKLFLGILLIIASIILGLYVGLWLCFIGGVVQVVEGIKACPVSPSDIAIGLLRFFASVFAGVITFSALLMPGIGMLAWHQDTKK